MYPVSFCEKQKKQQKNQKLAGYIWIHLDTSKPDVSRSVLNDSYTKITSLVFSKNWLDTSGYIWIHLDTSIFCKITQKSKFVFFFWIHLDTSGYIHFFAKSSKNQSLELFSGKCKLNAQTHLNTLNNQEQWCFTKQMCVFTADTNLLLQRLKKPLWT